MTQRVPKTSTNPIRAERFRFVAWDFDEAALVARLRYALDDGPELVEEYTFHGATAPTAPEARRALQVALRQLHLMAGISYYKAALPPRIEVEGAPLDRATAALMSEVYTQGLAEFAYRNQLDLRGYIHFPSDPSAAEGPSDIALERRTAVPLGGGKDSIVTLETLRRAGEPLLLLYLGDFDAIEAVVTASGLPCARVSRRLSPALLELNRRGAWNGHIPISAVIAFLLPVCALLYGFDAAALSNERSASVGGLMPDGQVVNHQYSKGLAFERLASRHLREHVLTRFNYFSFLRPLSELAIAKAFRPFVSQYECFTSCNRNFKIHDRLAGGRRWCLDCAKCRSTFLLLAPYVPKSALVRLFGADLLDSEAQIPGYGELLGIEGHKPFDCVGEDYEYAAAMGQLAVLPDWASDRVVVRLMPRLSAFGDPAVLARRALAVSDDHNLPARYWDILHAHLGA